MGMKNFGRVSDSISLSSSCVPGRYAKREIGSDFIPAIEVYAYRTPAATRAAALAQAGPSVVTPPAVQPAQPAQPADEAPEEPGRIRQAAAETNDAIL